MAQVNVRMKIINPQNGMEVEESALVDTGATFTVIPRAISKKLDINIIGKKKGQNGQGF